MMRKINRDNHYVPQMYLRQWTTDSHIMEYRLLVPHEGMHFWSYPGLSHVAVQRDLYVRIADNQENDDFEIDFNKLIETPATKPLLALCAGEKITPEEWTTLNDFFMAQYMRTPAYYFRTHEKYVEVTKKVLEETKPDFKAMQKKAIEPINNKENTLFPMDIKLSRGMPDSEHALMEIKTIVGKNLWLMTIRDSFSQRSSIRDFFRRLKWSIVICHQNYQWPTSDNPFIIVNPRGFNELHDGLCDQQNIFMIPISPSILLMSKSKGRFDWRINADEPQTKGIIRRIVNNAFLYVYAKQEDILIPALRPRTVDLAEYIRIQSMFNNWYSSYKEQEGPFLNSIHRTIV